MLYYNEPFGYKWIFFRIVISLIAYDETSFYSDDIKLKVLASAVHDSI